MICRDNKNLSSFEKSGKWNVPNYKPHFVRTNIMAYLQINKCLGPCEWVEGGGGRCVGVRIRCIEWVIEIHLVQIYFLTLCARMSIVDATSWLDIKPSRFRSVTSYTFALLLKNCTRSLHASNDLWTWKLHYSMNIYKKITWNAFICHFYSLVLTYTRMLQLPTQMQASITFNSTKMGSKPLFVRVNIKSRTIFVDSETGHTFKMKNRFPFVASHVALYTYT